MESTYRGSNNLTQPQVKTLILTASSYWFKRYVAARKLNIDECKRVDDSYQMQGYPRNTRVVVTNGSNRLDVYTINKAKERFDTVERDYI